MENKLHPKREGSNFVSVVSSWYDIPLHPDCRGLKVGGQSLPAPYNQIFAHKLPKLKKKNAFLITKWQKNKPVLVNRRVRKPTIYGYRRIKIHILHDNISGLLGILAPQIK